MKINHILVVCIGNICRSPMAEYFLRQQYPHLKIESAGISGLVGHAADEKANVCMQRVGIDMIDLGMCATGLTTYHINFTATGGQGIKP